MALSKLLRATSPFKMGATGCFLSRVAGIGESLREGLLTGNKKEDERIRSNERAGMLLS